MKLTHRVKSKHLDSWCTFAYFDHTYQGWVILVPGVSEHGSFKKSVLEELTLVADTDKPLGGE